MTRSENHAPTLEIHGARTGNCVRVTVALEELNLPYTVHRIDLRGGEQRRPPFLALNPNGHVPVLVDRSDANDVLVIAQSNAMLLHLDGLRPGVLLPEATRARAVALERYFYFLTDVIAPNFSAFYLRIVGAPTEAAERLSNRSLGAIAASERFLEHSPYMAGDHYSLADLVAATVIDAIHDRIAWAELPRLAQWFEEVRMRPAMVRGMSAFDHPRE